MAPFGIFEAVNNPPGSVVGMLSFMKRNHTLKFWVNVWSRRTNSCRLSNKLRCRKNWLVELVGESGSFPKMSFRYCAEIGLMRDAGTCVPVSVQAPAV